MSRKHIEKLISNHKRRLQKLRELQALQGLDTPPHILIEIEDIKAAIEELQTKLDTLENSSFDNESKQVRIEFHLQDDFTRLSIARRSAAIDAFAAVMGIAPQKIEAHNVYKNSIFFDLGVPSPAVQRLRFSLQSNSAQLRLLKVEKVIIEEELGQVEEWVIKEGRYNLVTFTHSIISSGVHTKSQRTKDITPYEMLGLLVDAGLKYEEGKQLLEEQEWFHGADKLLKAVEELEIVLGKHRLQDLFLKKHVNKHEWQSACREFRQAIETANRQVKSTLGQELNLPYGLEIVRQIAGAKGQILLDEGVELLQERGWKKYYPFSKTQEAMTKLSGATVLFRICPTGVDLLRVGRSRGLLEATARLVAIYLVPIIFVLGMGAGLFQTGRYFISTPPRPTPTLTALPATPSIVFTIRCYDGDDEKRFDVDDHEPITVPFGDSVIIETNVSARSVNTQTITPVDSPITIYGARQFLYSPNKLGLDIVDFEFFSNEGTNEYRSLFINIVPKEEGGLCYQ